MSILYPEPIRAFRFLIRVGDGKEISAAFSRFSGIHMQVESFQFRSGDDSRGVKDYVPVFTGYAPVTLSKGVVGDNEFLEWMFAACADVHSGPTGKELRRTIDVISLNEYGEPGVTWTLQDAMPIGYELSPLDGSRSEVLTESITFAITGMKRTTDPWRVPEAKTPRKKPDPSPIPRPVKEPRQKAKGPSGTP
ncbi:MAG TPA: phage tail protein [Candidatus Flavonifractor merdigallinarum]|uniref:Phage tail protein n=1 Tax=Candidatus Flavonifractor merdigallinarum TaxID=2838589 RepID=A0A9D1YDQ4_9FIRM|nr:phage tail protein [Candidatus Flavonifractor merdigallinarum]